MRRANQLVASTLRLLRAAVRPGISTAELDQIAEENIRDQGGVPSFKGYHGFPASACISVNDQVVHGIPGPRRLQEGDIVSIDLGAIVDGFHGDSAITVPVGTISDAARALIYHTYRALWEGIAQAVVGNRVGDISHAVQRYAEAQGYPSCASWLATESGGVCTRSPRCPTMGHLGAGRAHARHDAGYRADGQPWAPEIEVAADQWTVSTQDGKVSAHFEHTIAVTLDGPRILSEWPDQEEPI